MEYPAGESITLASTTPSRAPKYQRRLVHALATVVITALTLALGGGLIGWLLGIFDPNFFRDSDLGPDITGAICGTALGGVSGACLGMVLIFVLALRKELQEMD